MQRKRISLAKRFTAFLNSKMTHVCGDIFRDDDEDDSYVYVRKTGDPFFKKKPRHCPTHGAQKHYRHINTHYYDYRTFGSEIGLESFKRKHSDGFEASI